MFFTRLLSRSFTRQPRRRGLIALTVALSTAISVAMLGVVLDVGDKLNAELTTYGSNIVVQPKADAVVSGLYETGDEPDPTSFLKEDEVGNIKTIFWAYNIVDFAPSLTEHLDVSSSTADGGAVRVNGTWFNKDLPLSTGESVTAGVTTLRSWWDLKGSWPQDDADETVVTPSPWPVRPARRSSQSPAFTPRATMTTRLSTRPSPLCRTSPTTPDRSRRSRSRP